MAKNAEVPRCVKLTDIHQETSKYKTYRLKTTYSLPLYFLGPKNKYLKLCIILLPWVLHTILCLSVTSISIRYNVVWGCNVTKCGKGYVLLKTNNKCQTVTQTGIITHLPFPSFDNYFLMGLKYTQSPFIEMSSAKRNRSSKLETQHAYFQKPHKLFQVKFISTSKVMLPLCIIHFSWACWWGQHTGFN